MTFTEAANAFFELADEYLSRFKRSNRFDFYGVGFFCDASTGDVFFVANSQDFHERSFDEFRGGAKPGDEERFRWEIGNWKFPAGLFPSSSPEQEAFEERWAKIRTSVGDWSQEHLERFCKDVLLRIYHKPDSPLKTIEGLIVLGPDDSADKIIGKRIVPCRI